MKSRIETRTGEPSIFVATLDNGSIVAVRNDSINHFGRRPRAGPAYCKRDQFGQPQAEKEFRFADLLAPWKTALWN